VQQALLPFIPIDRSPRTGLGPGKHQKHGLNPQVIASPGDDTRWVCGTLPGSVHDKMARQA
jgi:hypothetical protein